jgi:hypothetical protein
MTIKAAMWMHGTAMEVERPDGLIPNGVVRTGDGTHFYGHSGSANWFHIAIPSPVILDGIRPVLTQVCVFYRLGPGASGTLTSVHLWDGPQRVREWNNLKLRGEHFTALDGANTWRVEPAITIKYGLKIAVQVHYAVSIEDDGGAPNLSLDFFVSAAGADFEV